MAEYKKQHYVPRFLLKKFSVDDKGKKINIFNITDNGFIENKAGIKEQCYVDYLYGKDGSVEHAFSLCETRWEKILSEIIKNKSVPMHFNENPELFTDIIFFILMQNSRNLVSIENVQEFTQKFIEKKYELENTGVALRKEAAAKLNLDGILEDGFWISDLHLKLACNNTLIPFVIGDNPVVFYNKLFEADNAACHLGYTCNGLVIFVPITPKITLIMYDNTVYKFGKKDETTIIINKQADVEELNKLQILNARENVYYSLSFSKDYKSLMQKQALTREKHNNVSEYQIGNLQMLRLERQKLPTSLILSFLKFKKKISQQKFIRDKPLQYFTKDMLVGLYQYELVIGKKLI